MPVIECTQKQLEEIVANAVRVELGQTAPPHRAVPTEIPESEIKEARRDLASYSKAEKTRGLGRCIRALAATRCDVGAALKFIETVWKTGDEDIATKILLVGSDTAGGFTVPDVLSDTFFELLQEKSVFMSMGPQMLPMSEGNKSFNGLATGASAYYIGEIDRIKTSSPTFRRVSMNAKKLAGIVPIGNDFLRQSSGAIDGMVSKNLIDVVALREDLAFIRGDGVDKTPIGLRNIPGINATAMTATPTFITISKDIANMQLRMRNNLLTEGKLGWLMAPRTRFALEYLHEPGSSFFPFKEEIKAGMFDGKPFAETTQIPINIGGATSELYLVDWDRVYVGDTLALTVDVSKDASYTDEAGVTRSAFQNDITLMRAIAEHDMAVDTPKAVEVLTGVTWAP